MMQSSLNYVLLNNEIIAKKKASVSVFDRAFQFGDGTFTTVLVEEGRIVFFDMHQKRLHEAAKFLGIKASFFSKEAVKDLIEKNEATKGLFRLKLLISGGESFSFDFAKREAGILLGVLTPYKKLVRPLRAIVYPKPIEYPLASIKTLSYLHRVFLADFAARRGVNDCITTNGERVLLEGVFSNLFWIHEQNFFFPDPALPYLDGITIQVLRKLAPNRGFAIRPIKARLDQIPLNASLYLCSSLKGFLPLVSLGENDYPRHHDFESKFYADYEAFKKQFSF